MKKIIIAFSLILFLTGCSCSLSMNTPTKKVEEFLGRYKDLDEGVINDLELSSEITGLNTTEQKEKYVDVMRRQYQDMHYEVVDEEIDGDEALVKVKVSVYDLYKARRDAEGYTINNESEFYIDNGNITDMTKVNNYILDNLYKASDVVDYTIDIQLEKDDGKWKVKELEEVVKEKLHGTYNYESN